MIPHPDSIIFLANIRHRELQEEAARMRLVQEACGDGPPMRAALAPAFQHLEETIDRARQYLECVRWAPTALRRSAVPR